MLNTRFLTFHNVLFIGLAALIVRFIFAKAVKALDGHSMSADQ